MTGGTSPTGCYAGAGFQEDLAGRQELDVAGDGAPVEKFCFTKGPDRGMLVTYTTGITRSNRPRTSGCRCCSAVHEKWSVRHRSLTVQVFTTAQTPEQLSRAAEFASPGR